MIPQKYHQLLCTKKLSHFSIFISKVFNLISDMCSVILLIFVMCLQQWAVNFFKICSRTDCAMAKPSCVDVPLPNSSKITNDDSEHY